MRSVRGAVSVIGETNHGRPGSEDMETSVSLDMSVTIESPRLQVHQKPLPELGEGI